MRVRRADPDRHRRPAGSGRRDHRQGRVGGQVRPQVPDQGRQPHSADGPAARRARRRVAGHRGAAVADPLLLHGARGRLHPRRRRADPRRRLLEEGPAAQRVLHARRPQRRRQRSHHLPRAGTEPGGAHAGWAHHGVGGTARCAADRDAGAQAGRGRFDDLGHGAAVHPRPRSGLPHPVLPGVRSRRLRGHPADPLPAQAALARRPVLRRRLQHRPRHPRRDARRPPRLGVRPARRNGSRGTGESRCGAGASGREADRVRTARRPGRRRPTGDHADPAPRRRDGAGACPHRRVVHAGVRRHRHPWWAGDRAADGGRCRLRRVRGGDGRAGPRRRGRRGRRRDPERQPHGRCGSRRGLREVVSRVG